MSLSDLVQHLDQLRMLLSKRGCSAAYFIGQQQFPTRRSGDLGQGEIRRSLIGDREIPNLLDGIAEEVHAYGMLLGGRKDVDDAAAYGELPAPLDEINPRVRGADQGRRKIAEIDVRANGEADRRQPAKPFDLRLKDAAHRSNDDPRGRSG